MKNKFLKFFCASLLMIPLAFSLVGCKDVGESVMVFFHLNDSAAETQAEFSPAYRKAHNLNDDTRSVGYFQWEYDELLDDAPTPEQVIPPTFKVGEETKKKVFGGWYYDTDGTLGKNLNKESWNKLDAVKNHSSFSLFAKWLDEGQNIITFNLENSEMSYKNDFTKNNENLYNENRVVTFLFNDGDDYSVLEKQFPKKENIDESQYTYLFQGWYLNPKCESGYELNQTNVKKLQKAGVHCFNVYAKWKQYPQVMLNFQNTYLEKYDGFIYNGSTINGLNKKTSLMTSYNDIKSLLPSEKDLTQNKNTLPHREAILTGPNQNVKIEGFYIDAEFTKPLKDNYDAFITECKNGTFQGNYSDNCHVLTIYTKLDYIRNNINLEFYLEKFPGATNQYGIKQSYLNANGIGSDFILNLKTDSFDEVLKKIPHSKDIVNPIFSADSEYHFIGWYIGENKGALTTNIEFNRENWEKLMSDKSIVDIRFYAKWDYGNPHSSTIIFNLDTSKGEYHDFTYPANLNFSVRDEDLNLSSQLDESYPLTKVTAKANYEFAGWYLSENCADGTEFTIENLKEMVKSGNHFIVVYSKFIPAQ